MKLWSILSDALLIAIWLGIPATSFLRRLKKPEDIGKRMLISVFGSWAGFALHREFIDFPIALARAEEEGIKGYDGAAVNAGVLLLGWIPAVITTAVAASIYVLVQEIRKRRRPKA